MPHPLAGKGEVDLIGNPIKLSATPVDYRRAPPYLGQHTEEVLRELLGLDEAAIAALRRRARSERLENADHPGGALRPLYSSFPRKRESRASDEIPSLRP